MGKHSQNDDEIPLTHSSNITRETRARFDTLLRAALDEEGNGKNLRKVDENIKSSKMKTKNTALQDKSYFNQTLEESLVKTAHRQSISSGVNLFSSSDDDVVVKRELHSVQDKQEVEIKRKLSKNNDNLMLDKKLKDERNSCQVVSNQEVEHIDDKVKDVRKSTRRKSLQYGPKQEHNELNLDNYSINPSLKTVDSVKKPVPRPRSKVVKKDNESDVKMEEEKNQTLNQSVVMSGSLSPLLPADHFLENKDSNDDDVFVAPLKIDKKRNRKKKDHLKSDANEEKRNEIELKDMNASSVIDVNKDHKTAHRPRSRSRSVEIVQETECISKEAKETNLTYEKIIGIFIHRSDCLKVDPLVKHPLVKVHLLDASSGNYFKKSSADRSVSFHYESKDIDYILPLMTEVFDFKERRSVVPYWEELLVFNEDFQCILKNDPPALILFEILDFVNFTVASSQYKKLGSEGGWHQIAWAFLKPVGSNGVLNTEKQVRLQLYNPQRVRKSACNNCDVYEWWSGGIWERYPGTLYVTVKGITPPEHLPPVLRSRSVLQGELSQSPPLLELDHKRDELETKSDNENSVTSAQMPLSAGRSLPSWSRLPSQSCKIPNHRKLSLPTSSRGCFYIKFSNSGLHLACSIASEEKFTIILFSIPDGKELIQFVGHQGLVYELHWSPKDTMLLSASADCTACLWDTDAKKTGAMQMLPHPSFVYSAQFHPGNSSVLVTGCCDHVVRIWSRPSKTSQYELAQELEGHSGFISVLTISSNGMIYSADSVGQIIEWMESKGKSKKQYSVWKLNRNISIREFRDTVINKLLVHPGGQRLLIHVRDSRLRMLDLSTASVIQWFSGALNHRVQTSACLSPCGGLVLAASEDGTVRVWNADTGEQLAIYSGLQFHRGTSSVDYHPYEHMTAFASYGSPAQIVVCDYEKLSSGKDIGLQMLVRHDISMVGTSNDPYVKTSTPLQQSLNEVKFPSKKNKKKDSSLALDNASDSIRDFSHFMGHLIPTRESDKSYLSPNSSVITSSWKDNDDESGRVKLTSIIEKMDQVLSRTPSRSSRQLSENYRNVDSQLSEDT